jgi:hypothetical protein
MKSFVIPALFGVFLLLASVWPISVHAASFKVSAFIRDHIDTVRVEIMAGRGTGRALRRSSPGGKLIGCYPVSDNSTDAFVKNVTLDQNGWVDMQLTPVTTLGVAYNCTVIR